MKLAELKRYLKPGMRLDMVHLQSVWRPGIRTVSQVNSVGFTLETIKPNGSIVQSHATWPKASYFESTDNGFIFYSDWYVNGVEQKRVPLLQYIFIQEQELTRIICNNTLATGE